MQFSLAFIALIAAVQAAVVALPEPAFKAAIGAYSKGELIIIACFTCTDTT